MVQKFYNFFKDFSQRTEFYKTVIDSIPTTANLFESFKILEDYLKQRCSDWPSTACPILLSMDEIHVLFEFRPNDEYSLYSCLQSVLSKAVSSSFCVIFLSTAINIPERTLSKDVAPSMQERSADLILPTLFTELPFDVYIRADPLAPGQADLTTVGSLKFTAKFGRPLCVGLPQKVDHANIFSIDSIPPICLIWPMMNLFVASST
jgi:hypothetical protein